MKKTKQAFSIPELLIFMTIVGVICVMMMTIIKPNERYIPYAYYSAYDALSTAVYNIHQDAINNLTYGDDAIPDEDQYFPGARDSYEDAAPFAPKELCKKLANNPNEDDDYGYINTIEYKCGGAVSTPEQQPKAYHFRATNSMKFWISSLQEIEIKDSLTNQQEAMRYFLVWVDLNGERKPNTTKSTASRPADIVPFLIFTNGSVIPTGNPISDTRYMTARIKYPGAVSEYSKASYSYAEAQLRAYGKGNEFPTYDPNSIYTKTNTNELIKSTHTHDVESIDDTITRDEKCDYEEGYPPSCTIVVDENKKL